MQAKVANQSDEHIGERRSGQHISEVSPRKRGHITSKKCQQQEDSSGYPGIKDGEQQTGKIVQRDIYIADIFHAARQQGITGGAEDGDSREDDVFSKRQWNSTKLLSRLSGKSLISVPSP